MNAFKTCHIVVQRKVNWNWAKRRKLRTAMPRCENRQLGKKWKSHSQFAMSVVILPISGH